jgi:hypothetical protein
LKRIKGKIRESASHSPAESVMRLFGSVVAEILVYDGCEGCEGRSKHLYYWCGSNYGTYFQNEDTKPWDYGNDTIIFD